MSAVSSLSTFAHPFSRSAVHSSRPRFSWSSVTSTVFGDPELKLVSDSSSSDSSSLNFSSVDTSSLDVLAPSSVVEAPPAPSVAAPGFVVPPPGPVVIPVFVPPVVSSLSRFAAHRRLGSMSADSLLSEVLSPRVSVFLKLAASGDSACLTKLAALPELSLRRAAFTLGCSSGLDSQVDVKRLASAWLMYVATGEAPDLLRRSFPGVSF